MRKLLGFLVVLCGIVSIAMTSRYGWKQADNEIDQVMSAMMFGTIALCAIIFDAVSYVVAGWTLRLKQSLQSVRPLHPERYSRFAACRAEAAEKADAKRSWQGVAISSPTGRPLQG